MPWTTKDVDKHKKGLTDEQKKTWVKVANSALKRCQDKGGEDCEASAIRQANSVVGEQKESDMDYKGYTTSTNSVLISINAVDVGGEAIPVGELVTAYQEQRGEGRGQDGEPQGDSGADKCVCPECGREVSHEKGTPCNETECPECGTAMTGKQGEVAAEMDVDRLHSLLSEALGMLNVPREIEEAQLSESASGHALALAEAQAVIDGPRAPLLMDVALITPGWGNERDNNYYPSKVLRRDARVFEGAKMYTSDHRPGEKSVRTEVSVIKQIKGFTDDGALIAQVAVHDPDFAEATRNRAKLGTLSSLECSILAIGRTKKGKVNDRKGNIVEAITSAMSVDWVTKGGRGGHAIALAESNTGGEQVAEEEQVTTQQETEEESQEATLTEDGGEEEITYLAESEIKEILTASRLPQQAQGRLAEGQYLDAEAVKAAIEQERAYIKELTGSGKPFAQGETAPTDAQMSEADYDAAYNDILKRHGLYVPEEVK